MTLPPSPPAKWKLSERRGEGLGLTLTPSPAAKWNVLPSGWEGGLVQCLERSSQFSSASFFCFWYAHRAQRRAAATKSMRSSCQAAAANRRAVRARGSFTIMVYVLCRGIAQ